MSKKKRIDMDKLASEMIKAGRSVEAIGWTGDPEKQKEIFAKHGHDILDILQANPDLSQEEKRRRMDELTAQAMKALNDAGIQFETKPVFAAWPLEPDKQD